MLRFSGSFITRLRSRDCLIQSLNPTTPIRCINRAAIEVGRFDNYRSRSARETVGYFSVYTKFVRNNNARVMRSFLIPFPAMHLRDAGRASGRLLVSSYMRHCPACIPSKILHLVERGIQRISGKASKSDNFCPRDFTRRGAARRRRAADDMPSKRNLTEANKINATRYIRIYTRD